MSKRMTVDQLNAMDTASFVACLGDLFEHSPWVAERAAGSRPFIDVAALLAALYAALHEASRAEQLALIRAHPQLAGKAALRNELTANSQSEQHGAGLDQCSPEEFARITALNADYQQRFGFPYILAVRGFDRSAIIADMAQRVQRSADTEFAEALRQIERIAALRLADRLE